MPSPLSTTPTITDHARERIRERVKIPKRAIDRTAKLALTRGHGPYEVKGRLKKYMMSLMNDEGDLDNLKFYNNKIFLFDGTTLITVYDLPEGIKA